MENNQTKVVKNASTGYGYKYSSLADLARAEVKIPKMRVKPTELGEFIEYWDGKEWQIGARIVLFESKSMNKAQIYGAALTYARRYTVQMAESIACDDDDEVEKAKPKISKTTSNTSSIKSNEPSEKQKVWLREYYIQKKGMSGQAADIKVRTFKTSKAISVEISKLIEEDKASE